MGLYQSRYSNSEESDESHVDGQAAEAEFKALLTDPESESELADTTNKNKAELDNDKYQALRKLMDQIYLSLLFPKRKVSIGIELGESQNVPEYLKDVQTLDELLNKVTARAYQLVSQEEFRQLALKAKLRGWQPHMEESKLARACARLMDEADFRDVLTSLLPPVVADMDPEGIEYYCYRLNQGLLSIVRSP